MTYFGFEHDQVVEVVRSGYDGPIEKAWVIGKREKADGWNNDFLIVRSLTGYQQKDPRRAGPLTVKGERFCAPLANCTATEEYYNGE